MRPRADQSGIGLRRIVGRTASWQNGLEHDRRGTWCSKKRITRGSRWTNASMYRRVTSQELTSDSAI
jgi:hypothetical protein